ncbi:MAG: DUF1385 domain-containing protein [Ruminococcaceae bacterium]|nr:DUF1385 domain-containing protein [Oscillospiraceae bacterium]
MEGIMMRGPKNTAMAVRNTKGELVVEEFPTVGTKRPAICRWPIIRGVFGYIDSMALGYKCLMRSAELSGLEDIVEEKPKKKKKQVDEGAEAVETENSATVPEAAEVAKEISAQEDKLPSWVMTLTMVIGVALGVLLAVGLFLFLPTFLYDIASRYLGFLQSENPMVKSLVKSAFEGILRVILLVGYMAAIALMKDIRRTFMYHGAEHKTIFCYEAGLELTVENVRAQRRFHPRCGTSFLILMVLVSIFVSFFIDPISIAISGEELPMLLRVFVKLLLIPFIVGLGYELIKFAGRHDNFLTRIISLPGVWLQHITVFEPTDDMIECAITAVKRVIPDDGSDNW